MFQLDDLIAGKKRERKQMCLILLLQVKESQQSFSSSLKRDFSHLALKAKGKEWTDWQVNSRLSQVIVVSQVIVGLRFSILVVLLSRSVICCSDSRIARVLSRELTDKHRKEEA